MGINFHTNGEHSVLVHWFMRLYTLRDRSNRKTGDQQQQIIPSINFTCNGSITKCIVAAKWKNAGGPIPSQATELTYRDGTRSYAKFGANTLSVSTAAANKYTADGAQYNTSE